MWLKHSLFHQRLKDCLTSIRVTWSIIWLAVTRELGSSGHKWTQNLNKSLLKWRRKSTALRSSRTFQLFTQHQPMSEVERSTTFTLGSNNRPQKQANSSRASAYCQTCSSSLYNWNLCTNATEKDKKSGSKQIWLGKERKRDRTDELASLQQPQFRIWTWQYRRAHMERMKRTQSLTKLDQSGASR